MTNPIETDQLLYPPSPSTLFTATLTETLDSTLPEETAKQWMSPIRSREHHGFFIGLIGQLHRLLIHEIVRATGADDSNANRIDQLAAQRDLLLFLANTATKNMDRSRHDGANSGAVEIKTL